MKNLSIIITILLSITNAVFADSVVNVYVWGGEIPQKVVQQFERKTGIKVNFSTYDSNETMYAKLRANNQSIYDVVIPSAYFVERMQKQNMLTKLDHYRLPNLKNISKNFENNDYDPGNQYSVPFIWGATGIFYNQKSIENPPEQWQDLWNKRWRKKLMLLDDAREIFSIALMSLGYSPNDHEPNHIQQAYQKLLHLVPNIKLFGSDGIQATIIDEDATIGTAWNGDAFKAQAENPNVKFIYPRDGFLIWVDCLAIPKNPPHPHAAYQFINFLLTPEIAAQIAIEEGHAITNQAGIKLLPDSIRNNPIVYPSTDILKHGYFQRDAGEEAVNLYNQYWQELKLAF